MNLDKSLPELNLYDQLPERIIQFGNGVLLRGLPDYYIQRANDKGVFNGKIVVVKSTEQRNEKSFEAQDFLFTHFIKGIENKELIENHFINSSISRLLHANTQWIEILKCSENPDINIIFSNTTEKGIVYEEEMINAIPPVSFPAKLLSYLFHRYQTLGNTEQSSMIIIPTELIENNGRVLKSVLLKLISFNNLHSDFIEWVDHRIRFSNSLVDRIVPGHPNKEDLSGLEEKLGYKDDFLIVSEPYNLWAIEGDEYIKKKLTFAEVSPGIKIEPDITKYREIKLRLLNASHSFSAGVALLNGFPTVFDAMSNKFFTDFISDLIEDIKPCLIKEIDEQLKNEFAESVKQRFGNPYIQHFWTSIIVNYTQKFLIRCVPLVENYFSIFNCFSRPMLAGLKAYIGLSIPDFEKSGQYFKKIKYFDVQLSDPGGKNLFLKSQNEGYDAAFKFQLHQLFKKNEMIKHMEKELENIDYKLFI